MARFKSYEQGRQKFQGEGIDWGWADEEPPEDVYAELLARTIATGGKGYVCVAAVHTVMLAREDSELRSAVLGADMVVPDGQPLVWAMNALGNDLDAEVTAKRHERKDEAKRLAESLEELNRDRQVAQFRNDVATANQQAAQVVDAVRSKGFDFQGAHAVAVFACASEDLLEVIKLPRTVDNAVVVDESADALAVTAPGAGE